ncbi:hypothetical protein HY493_01945 [Candidatus Woesearchaeota archaeon]|nr:hypothetical protein [Candidatus Woesearchaeota archaeon]
MPKKEVVDKALADAKRLEEQDIGTDEQLARQYSKDMENATSASRLLKRAWFTRDAKPRRKKPAAKRRK